MKKIIIAMLLLIPPSLSSAEIQWERYSFLNNTGGLNDAFSSISVADNEATDLQNIVFSTSGSFGTRSGSAKLNASTLGASVACIGLKYYRPTSGTRYLIGVFDDDKIRKMDYSPGGGPDGTWDDITGTLSFAAGIDTIASFAIGEDTLIIEDGINTTAPYKYTGSGNVAALSGSPPNATMVAYHKRMAFAAGNNTNPSTLYYSDLGNIENWTTGLSGNVNVETNDGTVIRAIVPGYDALYIFKDHSIWRLTGDDEDTFVLQRMISDIGVPSSASVGVIGNEFIIISDQGRVYIYDGSIGIRLISTKIEGTLDNINFSRLQYTKSVIFDDDYYFTISTAGVSTNNRVMVFDTFNNAWTKFAGINANAIAVADDGIGENILVFGDYGGFVYKYPSGTNDAGSIIDTYYVTKNFSFPETAPIKDWKLLRIFANAEGNYNLDAELRADFVSAGALQSINLGGGTALWGTAVFGVDLYGGQNLIIGRVEVNLEGNFFQVKFSNNNLDQPFEIRGYQIYVEGQDRL